MTKRKYVRKPKPVWRSVFHSVFGLGQVRQLENGKFARRTAGGNMVHDVMFADGTIRTLLVHDVQPDNGRAEAAAILSVEVTATAAEVHSAYRAAAMTTHPDHGGSAEAFHRVQSAYEALSCT
jgi:hypothetical protein